MKDLNIRCLVSGEETRGKISVFQEVVAPKSGPPLHVHENQHEVFHIISGQIEFELEGKRIQVSPGDSIAIPPGASHTFMNTGDGQAVIHFDLIPAGTAEVFFEKLCSGNFEDLPGLFAEHGLQLKGPPIS